MRPKCLQTQQQRSLRVAILVFRPVVQKVDADLDCSVAPTCKRPLRPQHFRTSAREQQRACRRTHSKRIKLHQKRRPRATRRATGRHPSRLKPFAANLHQQSKPTSHSLTGRDCDEDLLPRPFRRPAVHGPEYGQSRVPDLPKHRLKPNLCKPVFNEDHQSRVYLSCDGPKRLDVQFSLKDFVAYRYPNGL